MDPRDRMAETGQWYDSFDPKEMTLTVWLYDEDEDEEFEATFPAKYEVCHLCEGHGKHVNPSIDAHGISAEEFYDDPDFKEEYFNGMYDVICYCCKGKNVEPEVDTNVLDEASKKNYKLLEKSWADDAAYLREVEMERRMGC